MTPPDRICVSCGRAFSWRKAWARDWEQVRYCSSACRKRGATATDAALEAAILELLAQRADGATICPSEAARSVGGDDWQPLMEPARRAARRLVAAGAIEITQGGRVVDPSTARGPIRLRRTR
ncbi:MAG: DUF3253 domain-containing protein [Gaiellales bacterium]